MKTTIFIIDLESRERTMESRRDVGIDCLELLVNDWRRPWTKGGISPSEENSSFDTFGDHSDDRFLLSRHLNIPVFVASLLRDSVFYTTLLK